LHFPAKIQGFRTAIFFANQKAKIDKPLRRIITGFNDTSMDYFH